MAEFIRVLLLIVIALLIWIPIDLYMGRKLYIKKIQKHIFPKRTSNIELYTFGRDLYKQLFLDIEKAEHHVHVLFYIIRGDDISKEFCELLVKKAKEGLDVRVLLDKIGGIQFSKQYQQLLRKNGVHFSFSHRFSFPFFFFSLNKRNHRKITVIDGKIGYLGGFNMGEEYLGLSPELGLWRDYHIRMTGEGVQDLEKQFIEDWERETKKPIQNNSSFYPPLPRGKSLQQFVTTNGVFLQSNFHFVLSQAKKEVYIATPYFIPSKKLFRYLMVLLKKDIKVTIIVPQKEDHPLVLQGALPFLEALRQAGAAIYLFRNGFFHGKTIIVDDTLVDIGTANFDLRSLFLNDEMNCLIYDNEFVKIFKHHLQLDINHSNLLDDHYYRHFTKTHRIKKMIAGIFLRFF